MTGLAAGIDLRGGMSMICVVCNLKGHKKVLERGVSEDYARGCNDWFDMLSGTKVLVSK